MSGLGAVPIVTLDPPPEGFRSVNLTVTLTPFEPDAAQSFQLNNPSGGWALSQVVSLYVDNQLNKLPVTIVHGALNETTVVQAGAACVVPTLSNKANFSLNVSVQAGALTTGTMRLEIVASNYNRPKATFSTVLTQSISGVGNTQSLVSTIFNAVPTFAFPPWLFTPTLTLINSGQNVVLDSIDFALEGFLTHDPGDVNFVWNIFEQVATPISVAQGSGLFNVPVAHQWYGGASYMSRVRLTFWNGYFMTPGAALGFSARGTLPATSDDANILSSYFRFNISGAIFQ